MLQAAEPTPRSRSPLIIPRREQARMPGQLKRARMAEEEEEEVPIGSFKNMGGGTPASLINAGQNFAGPQASPATEQAKPEESGPGQARPNLSPAMPKKQQPQAGGMLNKAKKAGQAAGTGMQAAGTGVQAAGAGVEAAGAGVETAGKGVEMAGKGTEMAGKGVQMGGKAVTAAGTSLASSGAALSATGLGAIAGVPMMIAGGATAGAGAATQAAGAGAQVAGKGAQVAGKGMKAAGKGARKAGKGMKKAGGKVKKAGKKTKRKAGALGKMPGGKAGVASKLGQGMPAKLAATEQKKAAADLGKSTLKALRGKPKQAIAQAKEAVGEISTKATGKFLQSAWLNVIPSFGLTLLYVNFHFAVVYLGGLSNFFCRFGHEWVSTAKQMTPPPAKKIAGKIKDAFGKTGSQIAGQISDSMSKAVEIFEIALLLIIDFIIFIILLALMVVIYIIMNPLEVINFWS